MKKVYLFLGLMLSALAIGCNHSGTDEQTPVVPGAGKDVVTVNATLPSGLVWAAGDKVAINGLESSAVAEEGAGGSTYAFTASKAEAPLVVVAPFEILSGLNEVTVPALQSYVADAFDRAAYGVAGIATEIVEEGEQEKKLSADVDLLPVMGVISLPLTLDSATAENPVSVKSISVTALSGAALNGVYNAEATTATDEAGVVTYDVKMTAVADKVSATTTLDCGEGVAIDTVAPVYFNVVVPAGVYTGGFEIVVTDAADHNFILSLTDDVAVDRGAIVALTPSLFTVIEKAPATLTVKIAETGVVWAEGDAVVCNNSLSTNTVDATAAGTQTAQFSFDAVAYPYSVFYPAEYYTTSGSLRFYEEQTIVKNEVDRSLMVMAGYSSTNEVVLNNLCGVVSIPLTNMYEGETIVLDKIEVRTSEGDPIAGKYHVNYRTNALTSVAGKSAIVLNPVGEEFTIAPEETATVNFVVPKGSIRNGLIINLYTSVGLLENHRIFPTGVTVRGGETATADTYEYKEIKIEKIMTAEELIDFAKCVNMGRYKKYVNEEGKVVLGGDIDMTGVTAEWVPITGLVDEATGIPTGFDGVFDGCGYSIKNWATTQPLFGYLAVGATVQNVVIDASCNLVIPELSVYTLDGKAASNRCFGFVVASNMGGTVQTITNNAEVTCVCPDDSYAQSRAAIVGYNAPGGFVRDCVNNAPVTLDLANHTSQTCYIGTVVGRSQSSADAVLTGCGLYNLENHGPLTINITDEITSKNFYIGGVSGSANSHTIVDGCKNYADVNFNICSGEEKGALVCMAGVIGYSAGEITNCYNEGNVAHNGTGVFKASVVAGIVGYQNAPLANCINKGNITNTGKKFAGRNSMGGIDGSKSSSTAAPAAAGIVCYCYVATVDNCENYGTITFTQTEADGSGTSGYMCAAGIVAAPWGDVTNCKNFGDINFSRTIVSTQAAKNGHCYVGGIAATDIYPKSQSESSIIDCVNEGNITIHNEFGAANSAFGGIIGWPGKESECTNVTERCINKGNIVISGDSKCRAGAIQGGSGVIIDCQNTGMFTVNSANAGSVFGGLAGFHSGGYVLKGSTNTGNVVVNCDCTGVGGMIGNLGNSAHAEGRIVNNVVNCKVVGTEGTCGVGMVAGHFNGKTKTIYIGTADEPIKVAGTIQIGDVATVVDATNVTDPAVLGGNCTNFDPTMHLYNCVLAQ